jgi:hypothetical protein
MITTDEESSITVAAVPVARDVKRFDEKSLQQRLEAPALRLLQAGSKDLHPVHEEGKTADPSHRQGHPVDRAGRVVPLGRRRTGRQKHGGSEDDAAGDPSCIRESRRDHHDAVASGCDLPMTARQGAWATPAGQPRSVRD